MIQRKIDQLGEDDRRLPIAASVQGYQFDSAVVAKALGIDPGEQLLRMAQRAGDPLLLRGSLDTLRALHSESVFTFFLSLLAEALGQAGQVDEGLAAVEEALAIAERLGERYFVAEVYRLKGELLLKCGSPGAGCGGEIPETASDPQSALRDQRSKAEDCFRRAIKTARRQQARSLELRAVAALARSLRVQGKDEDARLMLAGVYGWFTEGFDTPDLQEAKMLLDELSA